MSDGKVDRVVELMNQLTAEQQMEVLAKLSTTRGHIISGSLEGCTVISMNDKSILERANVPLENDVTIKLDGPTYFEDDQECGYCHRPIGQPHKPGCRQ